MSKVPLKFREKSRFGSFYTGSGQCDSDICLKTGRMFFLHGDSVKILDQSTGQILHSISLEESSKIKLFLNDIKMIPLITRRT